MKNDDVLKLINSIKNIIRQINSDSDSNIDIFIFKDDIIKFIDICYRLNNYIKNDFFESIIYDTFLKYNDNYSDFDILKNVEKIDLFIKTL
mgnify:CR=1 FL=1